MAMKQFQRLLLLTVGMYIYKYLSYNQIAKL